MRAFGIVKPNPSITLSWPLLHRGADENPSAFLERLREALVKHTNMDPNTTEGQLILKDKFITWSTLDIRRKSQKLAIGPESTTPLFYHRDREEKEEKQERQGHG